MRKLWNPFSKREIVDNRTASGGAWRPTGHIGNRRHTCFWEPIYNPGFELEPAAWDWDLKRDSGPVNRLIYGPTLQKCAVAGNTFTIQDMTFRNCDFQGSFHHEAILIFDNCNFLLCDFAYSKWQYAHFKNCTFLQCSLSLSIFSSCEFGGCTWREIGMASKTDLKRTVISNPKPLIQSMVSRSNPSTPNPRHALNQWYRLQGTRAHVLRNIMLSHQSAGDEHNFYETVKLHELQRAKARISKDIFDIIFGSFKLKLISSLRFFLHFVDYYILRIFGFINNWGGSASQPLIFLFCCFFLFGFLYKYINLDSIVNHPFQKSFDITFLVGYTDQTKDISDKLRLFQDFHVICSVSIYSIFFATIVSKLSRSR
ncbi:hypothetical protein [Sphingomonas sp. R3G8C]|uniref:anti-phage Hailong system effector protein HalA n=1 Tax=Novosphingobium rhizosphaerae TaxID=1551649 RepID=UPI001C5463C9